MYQSDDETQKGCVLLFLSFFCFVAFIYFSYSTYMYCGFSPKQNPTVEGVIIKSAIEESNFDRRRGYTIDVTYEYYVNGNKYLSNRICCGTSSNDSSEEIVEKYPVGSEITVYYREKKPNLSVIEPRIGRSAPVNAYAFGFLFIWSFVISITGSQNSSWLALGMFGVFILSSSLLTILYPPSNKDAALNNMFANMLINFIIILVGLACIFYSYILKKKNA